MITSDIIDSFRIFITVERLKHLFIGKRSNSVFGIHLYNHSSWVTSYTIFTAMPFWRRVSTSMMVWVLPTGSWWCASSSHGWSSVWSWSKGSLLQVKWLTSQPSSLTWCCSHCWSAEWLWMVPALAYSTSSNRSGKNSSYPRLFEKQLHVNNQQSLWLGWRVDKSGLWFRFGMRRWLNVSSRCQSVSDQLSCSPVSTLSDTTFIGALIQWNQFQALTWERERERNRKRERNSMSKLYW